MSISIYYEARRASRLSADEQASISDVESKFSIDKHLEENDRTGAGYNWESFCIYDPSRPTDAGVIFEGATKLPDNSENAVWDGLRHWCAALTEIRRIIPDAEWRVHVDDHDIHWDADLNEYDPSQ